MGPDSKVFFSFRIPKSTLYLFILLLASSLLFFFLYKSEVKKVVKIRQLHKKYLTMCESKTGKSEPIVGGISIPKSLQNVPFADQAGIILSAKNILIRNIEAPYNASIIEHGNGYRLFFRHDQIVRGSVAPYNTYIGCCELDNEFNQVEKEYVNIDTKSNYSEDPRAVEINGKQYLLFNDLLLPKEERSIFSVASFKKIDTRVPRTMHIAELDKDLNIKFVTNLDIQLNWVEKNWTPFEYCDANNKTDIYFEYKRNPHKILKLVDPKVNQISHMNYTNEPPFQNLYWPKQWGEIRGGTPAIKVGDEYLAFFHSGFEDKDEFVWYVMGAYTFESKPPFKITGISHAPILFDGIFSSPHLNTSNPRLRCIYPAGFVVEHKDGRDLIHVSCGENDSAVKIITMDKEALFKSLKKL